VHVITISVEGALFLSPRRPLSMYVYVPIQHRHAALDHERSAADVRTDWARERLNSFVSTGKMSELLGKFLLSAYVRIPLVHTTQIAVVVRATTPANTRLRHLERPGRGHGAQIHQHRAQWTTVQRDLS
jgi:hypothetical protein